MKEPQIYRKSIVPDFQDLVDHLNIPGGYPTWDVPYIIAQRLLDAIKSNDVKLEILNQNVNLLIQDVRTVQAKLDAMENRLLLLLPYPWHPTTPTNPENPPYGTLLGPVTCEVKSYAEKEYSDMTIAELRKEQDKPIDKEAKP